MLHVIKKNERHLYLGEIFVITLRKFLCGIKQIGISKLY